MIKPSLKNFYNENPVPYPINITLTQKQIVDGQRIDDAVSAANFRHFRNLINRRLFGNTHKRYNRQLKIVCCS